MATKNLLEGRDFMALSHKEKNPIIPWTEKCQFLLMAFNSWKKTQQKKYVKGEGVLCSKE